MLTSGPGRATLGWRRVRSSLRTRILAWYVVTLLLATLLAVYLEGNTLRAQLIDRIDEALTNELTELNRLIRGEAPDGTCVTGRDEDGRCEVGRDPASGQPFDDDVEAIFDTFLRREIPTEHETMLSFVDGRFYDASGETDDPIRLEDHPDVLALADLTGLPKRDVIETPAGPVRYLASPVSFQGERLDVFVVAHFLRPQLEALADEIRVAAITNFAVLTVASVLAWIAAGRLLAPLTLVTRTAQSISESDLGRRIDVDGTDEAAELAATFNAMLDRLEQAFATQRQFLDDAGHELRTPITIIRGHLELMTDDPAERDEVLAIVTDELDRMSRIVSDLLVLARAEHADFLQPEEVQVGPLTRDIYTKATALAPRRWELETVAEGRVTADRQRLTQALVQLAQNAASHTEPGDVIALGSTVTGAQVRLWVRDTGPGVAPEDAECIFERFRRLGQSRSEGAGLGLAIVRVIAEAHGGAVELDSTPGEGATFTLRLPTDPRTARSGEL